MKIDVLVENKRNKNIEGIKAEHGLSIYVESNNKKVLVDLGGSDLFLHNANSMGISIEDVDILVISHGHIDHIGGLEAFLDVNKKATIYAHKEVKQHFIAKVFGLFPINISINNFVFEKHINRFIFIEKDYSITPELKLFTNFDGEYPKPPSNKSLYIRKGNKNIKDDFNHEIALGVLEDNKIFIFSSCSHSGIYNIIKTINNRWQKKLHSVIGGFHLSNPVYGTMGDKEYIKKLALNLESEKDVKYYTCHCTGYKNIDLLKEILAERVQAINTGESLIFS